MGVYKKTVVMIRSNPVNPDSRVEKEAMSLSNHGYNVIILGWDRDSNYKAANGFLNLGNKEIPIIRFGFKASYGEGFKNIIPYLKFQMAIRKWLKTNEYDIVHACDFDTAFSTYKLVLKRKKKLVFDIFDFLYTKPKGFFQKKVFRAQFSIIKNSDATIICTEDRLKQIEGSKPKKVIVIHNTPSKKQLELAHLEHKENNQKIKVCYIGILQNGRLLKEIGHYFAVHEEFEFYVGGFGYLEQYFVDLSNTCKNVHFLGKVQYKETLSIENNSDIMLAIYDPSYGNHVYAAPNKFYEALMLGKPLIMAKGTGMSKFVSEYSIGELIDFNENGFANGMAKISSYCRNPSIIQSMKSLYEKEFNWDVMEDRLVTLYKNL